MVSRPHDAKPTFEGAAFILGILGKCSSQVYDSYLHLRMFMDNPTKDETRRIENSSIH